MNADFDRALAVILVYEGGYCNNPADPGGPTNMGVTQDTLCKWRGRSVSIADMKALTRGDVGPIYKQRFWGSVEADDLPAGVDLITFDAAVQHGPFRAAKFLQEAVTATPDGHIGPHTIVLVKAADPLEVIEGLRRVRASFYRGLSTFDTFGRGWMRRLENVATTAATWAGKL